MIDFPVLDERAEVVYQRQHMRMKRTVEADGMRIVDCSCEVSLFPLCCDHSTDGRRRMIVRLRPLIRCDNSVPPDGFSSRWVGSSGLAPSSLAIQPVLPERRVLSESKEVHPLPSRCCCWAQDESTITISSSRGRGLQINWDSRVVYRSMEIKRSR